MGREKALLRVAGETLIERQLRTLRAAGVRDILLSLRVDLIPGLSETSLAHLSEPGDPPPTAENPSTSLPDPALLIDQEAGLGPLAGIVPALARSGGRHLLVLAVDMPEVRPSLLHHLLSRATPGTGVAPKVGGMWEPLCALYPPGSLDVACHLLEGGSRSPAHLLDELEAQRRVRGLALSPERARGLRSWNTPADVR